MKSHSISNIVQEIVNYVVSSNDEVSGTGPSQASTSFLQVANKQLRGREHLQISQVYEIYRATGQLSESESDVDIRLTGKLLTQSTSNVPPSYSTVIRQGRPSLDIRQDVRSVEVEQISPFITRLPPPSYGEIEGTWHRDISNISSEQVLFGPDPIYMWCTRCYAVVITTTELERSKFTHFTAVALCLCGCWPCCLLPYCMSSCKNTNHYCPNCSLLLGTYRPW